jgi:hypothetical protein
MDISIFGSVLDPLSSPHPIISRYNLAVDLDLIAIGGASVGLVPVNGKGVSKLAVQTPLEPTVIGGSNDVFVSLRLDVGDVGVRLNQIFTVQVLVCTHLCVYAKIVNAGEGIRNFQIIVPDRYKDKQEESKTTSNGIVVDARDFYAGYMEFEKREATLICLEEESVLRFVCGGYCLMCRELKGNSCMTCNLHFIPIKGQLHTIEELRILDLDSGVVDVVGNCLSVFIK